MPDRVWYKTNEPELIAALAKRNTEGVRRWLSKGRRQGWLKVGKHIKPEYPQAQRVTWLVNLPECLKVGAK